MYLKNHLQMDIVLVISPLCQSISQKPNYKWSVKKEEMVATMTVYDSNWDYHLQCKSIDLKKSLEECSGLYSEVSMDVLSLAIYFLTPCIQYLCQGSKNESNKDNGSCRLWFPFIMDIFWFNEVLQRLQGCTAVIDLWISLLIYNS